MSLSDRLEILGEQAQMYPQGTRKASKVGCKAHRAQLRTRQNHRCSNRTEEYSTVRQIIYSQPGGLHRSGYSFVRFGVTFTQPAALVAPRLMLDPDEALHYLDFLESRAVAGEDEPPRDAASTALAAAPHALPSRTAPALEVAASRMDDGPPSPTAAELEDERVRNAVIAADARDSMQARKRARRASAPPRVSAKLLVLPAWLLPARPEIAPAKMPKIAPAKAHRRDPSCGGSRRAGLIGAAAF